MNVVHCIIGMSTHQIETVQCAERLGVESSCLGKVLACKQETFIATPSVEDLKAEVS